MTADVLIGRLDGDFIAFSVLSRVYPEAQDYWDGNWVATQVTVTAGGFAGAVCANLRVGEFRAFRLGLEAMASALGSTAAFESMEEWVSVDMTCTPNGRLDVKCTLADNPAMGNRLSCSIAGLDQSFLLTIIAQLSGVATQFPERDG